MEDRKSEVKKKQKTAQRHASQLEYVYVSAYRKSKFLNHFDSIVLHMQNIEAHFGKNVAWHNQVSAYMCVCLSTVFSFRMLSISFHLAIAYYYLYIRWKQKTKKQYRYQCGSKMVIVHMGNESNRIPFYGGFSLSLSSFIHSFIL